MGIGDIIAAAVVIAITGWLLYRSFVKKSGCCGCSGGGCCGGGK